MLAQAAASHSCILGAGFSSQDLCSFHRAHLFPLKPRGPSQHHRDWLKEVWWTFVLSSSLTAACVSWCGSAAHDDSSTTGLEMTAGDVCGGGEKLQLEEHSHQPQRWSGASVV